MVYITHTCVCGGPLFRVGKHRLRSRIPDLPDNAVDGPVYQCHTCEALYATCPPVVCISSKDSGDIGLHAMPQYIRTRNEKAKIKLGVAL